MKIIHRPYLMSLLLLGVPAAVICISYQFQQELAVFLSLVFFLYFPVVSAIMGAYLFKAKKKIFIPTAIYNALLITVLFFAIGIIDPMLVEEEMFASDFIFCFLMLSVLLSLPIAPFSAFISKRRARYDFKKKPRSLQKRT